MSPLTRRRLIEYRSLIHEIRLHNRHQDALVSGRAVPTEEELGADKQGAFVGEGTPHDAGSKLAGCSAGGPAELAQAGVAGSIPARSTKRFSYELVRDDRQGGWFDPGHGVRNVQTGILMNDVPISTERKAQELLDRLEEGE